MNTEKTPDTSSKRPLWVWSIVGKGRFFVIPIHDEEQTVVACLMPLGNPQGSITFEIRLRGNKTD